MSMKNKKILFISQKFFGYEFAIKNELEKMGACIYWFDDRPSNSLLIKGLLRLKIQWLSDLVVFFYHNSIFKKTSRKKNS